MALRPACAARGVGHTQTGRYLPDHQAFCHRWRAPGGEVWADEVGGLRHVGSVTHVAKAGVGTD